MLGDVANIRRFLRQTPGPEFLPLWNSTNTPRIRCAAMCSEDPQCHSFTSDAGNQICIGYAATASMIELMQRNAVETNTGAMTMFLYAEGKNLYIYIHVDIKRFPIKIVVRSNNNTIIHTTSMIFSSELNWREKMKCQNLCSV